MINLKKSVFWCFVIFWLFDSILLWLAGMFYPAYFVFGTYRMNAAVSIITAGFVWTLLVWLAGPVADIMSGKKKSRAVMFGFYFVANFVALWLTARLAPITGFGTTRFVWLVYLALVADVVQYIVWKTGGFKKMLT